MGLDVGERRIGVALGDPDGVIASPLTVISGVDGDAARGNIIRLAAEYEVGCIVVGLPRSLDGSLGRQARSTEEFIRGLSHCCDIPIESWDERLSTVSAEQAMVQGGAKRKKRKEWRDAVAAALILQTYLDRKRSVNTV